MKLIGALLAVSVFAGATLTAAAEHARTRPIHVAIYRGPASCEDCSEAIARAVTRYDRRYIIDFVGPGERTDVTPATLRHYQVYVQPGGGQDIDAALGSLGPARVAAIRGYVAQGGGYLGICMGAYLAGASDLGLIRDDLDSEVQRPGFAVRTETDSAVPVHWQGQARTVFYQDGPFLHARVGERGFRLLATYQNGDIAAARYTLGKGRVVLSGPHPEADRSWFDDADLTPGNATSGTPIKTLLDQLAA